MQQPEKAIPLLKDALRLDPRFLPARAALGQALLQTGKPAEAIPLLESAIGTDQDGSLHFQLFRAYQLTGQAAKAREALVGYQRLRASLAR
jgi:predicted Zn-dependent protease